MNKYRMFVATFTYAITTNSATEFDYAVIIPEKREDASNGFEQVAVRPTYDEALAFAVELDAKITSIVKQPRPYTVLYSESMEFDTERAARSWLERQRTERGHTVIKCHVDTVTFDEDDLISYEHNPCYTVELEVKVIKRIEVEIDTSTGDFDHIEDEYDAEQHAVNMAENGDLQEDIDCADEWDVEIESIGSVED